MSEAKRGKNHPLFGKIGKNSSRFSISLSNNIITKISIAKEGDIIYVYDIQSSLINTFSSARKAAAYFNTNHQIIMRYVKNGKIFKKWKNI